ncbi:sigma-54 dependent response regulator [Chlamydia abortus]|jgi:DNA-binding response OmpR family regulator|uniref:Response regulator transcription factor n=1 Tax=Paenibacillus residui TaxID=629724 RepID=A0ABW3D8Y2_9BACL|nr:MULTISPECIES: response regulator transcription factor [Paenibacillaceae]SHE10107.1 sigma-54 dependent response regulator [Chlamydia abortus]
MNKQVLIVDDDKEIAKLIEIYLVNEGYKVIKAHNGREALKVISTESIQLVILDVMMPGLDGLEVCRQIREKDNIPILMLSAKGEDIDKILGLTTGADDYMVKPFNPLELLARVKSLFRRTFDLNPQLQASGDGTITIHSLQINKSTHTVTVEGHRVNLTSLEFDILYLLASHPGRVFSAEEIFERVWKEKYYQSHNTVMVHISKLRDKLESEPGGTKLIQTVWGVGYKIDH